MHYGGDKKFVSDEDLILSDGFTKFLHQEINRFTNSPHELNNEAQLTKQMQHFLPVVKEIQQRKAYEESLLSISKIVVGFGLGVAASIAVISPTILTVVAVTFASVSLIALTSFIPIETISWIKAAKAEAGTTKLFAWQNGSLIITNEEQAKEFCKRTSICYMDSSSKRCIELTRFHKSLSYLQQELFQQKIKTLDKDFISCLLRQAWGEMLIDTGIGELSLDQLISSCNMKEVREKLQPLIEDIGTTVVQNQNTETPLTGQSK
jgi:hypothetical protein